MDCCCCRLAFPKHPIIGSIVVPFCGLYLVSYKVIPKRNYDGASGYMADSRVSVVGVTIIVG